jgi:hypothetical protein
MRYQPLDSKVKNGYVGAAWTERELKRYMRYWSRCGYLEHIPFDEYSLENLKVYKAQRRREDATDGGGI